ncbi:MAG TPA: hypothetical protein VGK46_00465 [Saprospiraceae bacterium]
MKNYQFLYILCFCLVSLSYGCEKAELQKSIPNDTVQIDPRGNCIDCPGMDECCCIIEWTGGDPGYFSICGTSDGDAATCEIDPSPCENDIDGLQHSMFFLGPNDLTHNFCMNENAAFQIYRFASPSGATSVRFHCRRNQFNPSWTTETFNEEDRSSYDVDGSCILEGPCGG